MGRVLDSVAPQKCEPPRESTDPVPAGGSVPWPREEQAQADSAGEGRGSDRHLQAAAACHDEALCSGAENKAVVRSSVSPQKKRGRPPRFGEPMSNSLRSRLKREARRGEVGDTLRLLIDLLLTDSPEAAAFKLEIGEIRGYSETAARVLAAYGLAEEWARIAERLAPGASHKRE